MRANPLSWSISRATVLRYCAKKYYFKYYTYHLRVMDRTLWLNSLTLKSLQSIDMWVWEKTHKVLSEYLRLIYRDKLTDELFDEIKDNIREEMERDFKKSKIKDFDKYDKYNRFGLSEHYYGQDIDDKLGEAIEKVYKNLDAFANHEFTAKLRETFIPENKIYIEPKNPDFEKMKFVIDVPELLDVVLWGAPDFGIITKEGKYIIYDWKSGKEDRKEWEVSEQLKVYTQKILSNTGVSINDIDVETYEVYVPSMNMYGGKVWETEVEEAVQKIIKDVDAQKKFLKDEDITQNQPLESVMFKRTEDVKKCDSCTFRKVCTKLKEFEWMDMMID